MWFAAAAKAILCVLLAIGAPALHAAKRGRLAPPSFVLVTLDTTRADHLGCYGAESAATPTLDALAATGVRFEMALSPAPLTLPSHATMMTGRVPRRHGARNNALHRLDPDAPVLAERLRGAHYDTAAFVSAAVLDRVTGIDRGFEHYDDNVRVGDRHAFNYEERAASQTTDAVLAHLGELKRPFFLWVHYFDPHLPYVPPEPYRSRFAGRPYDGEIAFMDAEIGRLLAAIRRKEPDPLIVVAGDHGESLGEHGEQAHGVFVYQATQRVPLILAGPGVPQGRTVRHDVGLVDLAPTVLDLLGLPAIASADGRSLAPLPMPPPEDATDATYEMESFFPSFAYGWSPLRALVRAHYKFIEAPQPELYDISHDPAEKTDLLADADGLTPAARHLRSLLLERVGDDDPGSVALDPELAEQRERLAALGYVGGTGSETGDDVIDPKQGVRWLVDLDAARAALQGGRPAEALEPLERLISRNQRNVPAHLLLVQCRLMLDQPDEAVEVGRHAVELSPDDELTHFHLANALAASPEGASEAYRHYERALAVNPRFPGAYLNYAAALSRAGDPASAREVLARAGKAKLRHPDIDVQLAVLELRRGNVAAARAAFARALELNPCAERVHEALGRMAHGAGKSQEAADHYENALACEPRSAALAKTLGSIYMSELEQPERARALFERALALTDPADPDAAVLRDTIEQLKKPR